MILLVTVFDVISATAPDPFLIQILGSESSGASARRELALAAGA